MKVFLLLAAVFVCGHNGLGWALRVEVYPKEFNVLEPVTVNVSCVPSASINREAQEIMMLEIARQDSSSTSKPIAILTRGSDSRISGELSNNLLDYEVQGRIDNKTPSKSVLTLTLLNPRNDDAGLYQCSMYHVNDKGHLTKQSAGTLLTAKNLGINSALEYLVDKVSALEAELRIKDIMSAFSARYTGKGTEDIGETIVFSDVIMKVGQGYDETTGLFTAPISGVYGFHLTAMMRTANGWISLAVYVNAKKEAVVSIGSKEMWDQSSTSIDLKLRTSDVVKVVVNTKVKGNALRNELHTFFSGHLIRETTT